MVKWVWLIWQNKTKLVSIWNKREIFNNKQNFKPVVNWKLESVESLCWLNPDFVCVWWNTGRLGNFFKIFIGIGDELRFGMVSGYETTHPFFNWNNWKCQCNFYLVKMKTTLMQIGINIRFVAMHILVVHTIWNIKQYFIIFSINFIIYKFYFILSKYFYSCFVNVPNQGYAKLYIFFISGKCW